MKLLFISAAFPPFAAGEADHALELARRLAARGLDVRVLTTAREGTPDESGFEVDARMESWSWLELPRFRRALREWRPEAVLLFYSGWTYNHHPMITLAPTIAKRELPSVQFVTKFTLLVGAPLLRIRLREGFDVAIRLHSHVAKLVLAHKLRAGRVHKSLGSLLTDSDALLVMSGSDKRKLGGLSEYGNPLEKCAIDPPPPLIRALPDPDESVRRAARAELGVADGERLLAYFGYIYGGKGLEPLVESLARLPERVSAPVRLMLIGGIPAHAAAFGDRLLALADSLGVRDRLIVTGEYETGSDLPSRYLHAADVAVLPFEDGAQLYRSSIAAVAVHGLPLVTTRSEDTESAFRDRENALLCEPSDADDLTRAVAEVLGDEDLGRRLGRGAVRLAEEWFSWEASLDRTLAAIGARPVRS